MSGGRRKGRNARAPGLKPKNVASSCVPRVSTAQQLTGAKRGSSGSVGTAAPSSQPPASAVVVATKKPRRLAAATAARDPSKSSPPDNTPVASSSITITKGDSSDDEDLPPDGGDGGSSEGGDGGLSDDNGSDDSSSSDGNSSSSESSKHPPPHSETEYDSEDPLGGVSRGKCEECGYYRPIADSNNHCKPCNDEPDDWWKLNGGEENELSNQEDSDSYSG